MDSNPVGPYSKTIPRLLRWSRGVGRFRNSIVVLTYSIKELTISIVVLTNGIIVLTISIVMLSDSIVVLADRVHAHFSAASLFSITLSEVLSIISSET